MNLSDSPQDRPAEPAASPTLPADPDPPGADCGSPRPLKIRIGPARFGNATYEIIDPPGSWIVLPSGVGYCTQCKSQLHLVFSDARTGSIALCQCEETEGNRRRRRLTW